MNEKSFQLIQEIFILLLFWIIYPFTFVAYKSIILKLWRRLFYPKVIRLVSYLILIILILVNVAFVTLFERKILGYRQIRKGPNKVRIIGLIQPFNDAIKLFSKELVFPNLSNIFQYFISPILGLIIVLIRFILFPFKEMIFSIRISLIFVYIILRINVYPVLFSGWASNRKYALLGRLRSVAQTVSYEVRLALILIFF